jgi:Aldolase/RraA
MASKRTPLELARAATANARAAADQLHEVTEDLTPRLAKLYTGIVHDVMRGMGLKNFTLPHTLHPVTVARTIAGPVFTVRGKVDAKADPHATLLAWTGFLSKAKSGHVVVIAANDEEVAHMGELSGETLMRKGVPGVVVDGGCRDVEFLMEMGFAVYALHDAARHRRLLDGRRHGRADQDRQGRDRAARLSAGRSRRGDRGAARSRRRDRVGRGGGSRYRKPDPHRDPRRHGPAGGLFEVWEVLSGHRPETIVTSLCSFGI